MIYITITNIYIYITKYRFLKVETPQVYIFKNPKYEHQKCIYMILLYIECIELILRYLLGSRNGFICLCDIFII